jgi:UDP-N-acetylglucosamine diphosphorylase/glucosamine-1-phosphate N-acetyltransferase
MNETGVVILAAGLGTRMKSDKAKVLHEICGRAMIHYVVQAAATVAGSDVVVVVGHQAEKVKEAIRQEFTVRFAYQDKQHGTGHAVLCAMPHIPDHVKEVVILCGDVPLIRPATIANLVSNHSRQHRDVTVLAVKALNPTGYGRLLFDPNGQLVGIVEESDADLHQKQLDIVNSGIYVVKRAFLDLALPQIKADNIKREIYLTDIIAIGFRNSATLGAVIGADCNEVMGVNSPAELQAAENLMKSRFIEKS